MTPDGRGPSFSRRQVLGAGAIASVAATLPARASAQDLRPREVKRLADGILFQSGADVVEVRLPLDGVASVERKPVVRARPTNALFRQPADGAIGFIEKPGGLRLVGTGIIVELGLEDGRLSFYRPDGTPLIAESAEPDPIAGMDALRRHGFASARNAPLHGLGQYRDPVLDYRDRDQFIAHANSDAASPLLVSADGWGLLWETAAATYFRSRGQSLAYHSIAADVVRYHVFSGQGIEDAVRAYRRLTGAAALLPRWAYGYWQSKERYQTQDEVLAVAREYRARKLPIDAIVQDWRYWGDESQFSSMQFDPAIFPDAAGMMRTLHDLDIRLLTSVWPAFGAASAIHKEMAAGGHLFPGRHWGGTQVFDTSNPAARAIYWKHIKEGLIDKGVDGLWTDGNEPEFQSTGERYGTTRAFAARAMSAAGPIAENQLTFSWFQAKGLSEGMMRDRPSQRPVILSRSAYAGQQAFGAITWSGDIFASWGTLANQIVAASNFSMAGIPWWTCDIGGFFTNHRYPGALDDPAYRELYVRWFQFAAFLPIFRAHGTHIPRELWQFGEEGSPAFEALRKALHLRYTLMPYVYSLAGGAAHRGETMVRGLSMHFPDDAECLDHPAQYMFGPSLLVRVVDRPFDYAPRNIQEFIPNRSVRGRNAPAASVEFFEGAAFDRRIDARLTDDLKMSWKGDLPSELSSKAYSVRWTGEIWPEESGPHHIVIMGKGSVLVRLNDKVVVDDTAAPAGAADTDGGVSFREHNGDGRWDVTVDLEAGKPVPFLIEQRQPAPDVVSFWFEWITPSHAAKMTPPASRIIDVYLPAGTTWRRLGGGPALSGGRSIDVAVALDEIPVFVPAGSILVLSPSADRAAHPDDVYEVHVYPGKDGRFDLYEDEGEGLGYRSGDHGWTILSWDDAAQSLDIKHEGRMSDRARTRKYDIYVVGDEPRAAR